MTGLGFLGLDWVLGVGFLTLFGRTSVLIIDLGNPGPKCIWWVVFVILMFWEGILVTWVMEGSHGGKGG